MAESGARVTLHSPQPLMTSASLATWRAVTEPELGPRRAPETVGKMSNPPVKENPRSGTLDTRNRSCSLKQMCWAPRLVGLHELCAV